MADTIEKVRYFYTEVADQPGAGAKVFNAFKDANVSFSAVVAFPKGRRAQLDFVARDPAAFKASAKKAKIKLVGPNTAFLIQGEDCTGVIADIAAILAGAGINITAVHAIAAGNGRYGGMLWVKPSDVRKAARLLIDAETASSPQSHNILERGIMDRRALAILLAVVTLIAALQVARVMSGGAALVNRRIFPTWTSRMTSSNSGLRFHDRAAIQNSRG